MKTKKKEKKNKIRGSKIKSKTPNKRKTLRDAKPYIYNFTTQYNTYICSLCQQAIN